MASTAVSTVPKAVITMNWASVWVAGAAERTLRPCIPGRFRSKENQIVEVVVQSGQALFPRLHGIDPVSLLREDLQEDIPDDLLVLHNQDSGVHIALA